MDSPDREAYLDNVLIGGRDLKRELATRQWRDMNEYADAKSELIAEIVAAAEA